MIRLGAQLYTIREFTQTPEDIRTSLRKIRDLGFTDIQISGFGYMDPEELAALVKELGLYVCCTHSPFDRMKNDLDQLIAEHKMLGCDTIGLGMMPRQYQGSLEALRSFIQDITPIAREMKAQGMQFAYHNHNMEFECWDGAIPMDVLIAETDPDLFHFILDTYWIQMGGANPAAYIRKVKDRMKVCHFKDFAVVNRVPTIAEVGVGNIDFRECFRACEDAHVQDIVIEQDTCPRDPFDCLRNSYENLKVIAADH